MPTLAAIDRRRGQRAILALTLALSIPATACASTRPGEESYPDIVLTYGDLPLRADRGPSLLVARIEQTAVIHCARYGALLTPARYRGQPRYCIDGVRAEIVRTLSPELRTVYETGRRRP